MAQLICTGEHEAISLKSLHGHQVLQFDQVAADAAACGGDHLLLAAFEAGLLKFCRLWTSLQFYPMKHKREKKPTE